MTQPLADLVQAFLGDPEGAEAAALLEVFRRHVRRATRTTPAGWFASQRRDAATLDDLARRCLDSCARTPRPRYPFSGREPFVAYLDEQLDSAAIRYHTFYARLSVLRELMHDDYAANLVQDFRLPQRIVRYQDVGRALARRAEPVRQGPGLPPLWRLWRDHGAGPREPEVSLTAWLRADPPADLDDLVVRALQAAGVLSQARLTYLADAVLPPLVYWSPGGWVPDLVDAEMRAAAQALAREEFLLGHQHTDRVEDVDALLRLAEHDEPPRPYRAGPFVVSIATEPGQTALARQDAGPEGTTLEVGGHWFPLEPGRAVPLDGIDGLDELRLHDAAGRSWTLQPD